MEKKPGSKARRASSIKASENIKELSKKKQRNEEYEVESIVSHSVVDGVTIYKVTWVGYPGEFTDLKEDDLENCKELLDEYKAKLKGGNVVQSASTNGELSSVDAGMEQIRKRSPSPEVIESVNKIEKQTNENNKSETKKKQKKRAVNQSDEEKHNGSDAPKGGKKAKRIIAPDAELGYMNGCVVDSFKGFSAKYKEPVVLVSYKEPLPSGLESKQDEIVPVRIVASKQPQELIAHLVELLSTGRGGVAV